MKVLACTGLEDKLQEDVASCIHEFREAGIKFWMLTGDNGHTAEEIGKISGIFDGSAGKKSQIIKLEAIESQKATQEIAEAKKGMKMS